MSLGRFFGTLRTPKSRFYCRKTRVLKVSPSLTKYQFFEVFMAILGDFWSLLADIFGIFGHRFSVRFSDMFFDDFWFKNGPQNGSKNGPCNYAKRAQNQKRALDDPGAPQGGHFGSILGSILDPFCPLFGPFLDPFERQFIARQRQA